MTKRGPTLAQGSAQRSVALVLVGRSSKRRCFPFLEIPATMGLPARAEGVMPGCLHGPCDGNGNLLKAMHTGQT